MIRIDWKQPDYREVIEARLANLDAIRAHPEDLPALRAYYGSSGEGIADFINDFGWTYDPRNVERGLPATVPFVLFPKQRDWVCWLIERWRTQTPGATEKSRDCGLTWLAVASACTLCIFHSGMAIGFGSRKSEYVDKIGTMKPILPKGRIFMDNLPAEFSAGYVAWRDSPYMRINFPDTGSIITGEGGDDLGRGDRASIFVVDEAEHLERPDMVEFALSQTTNCRIDISSVNGSANPVARKILERRVDVFVFDYRDDPRKSEEWYKKQCDNLDPVVVAQEIDRDRAASVHGVVIPGTWVRAAIGACQKLGFAPTGEFRLALDVADEGRDKNAVVGGKGVEISVAEQWSGRGSDTFATVERAFEIADDHGCVRWRYDGDGLGAGVRGDARVINERRRAVGDTAHDVVMFRGSEAVVDPDGIVEGTIGHEGKGRTNQDYYLNSKSQGWFELRRRFRNVYRWVVEEKPCAPDDIISLDPRMPNLMHLVAELSQPTYSVNGAGKMVINKTPDGLPSPNLADGAMIHFAKLGTHRTMFSTSALAQIINAPRRRHR